VPEQRLGTLQGRYIKHQLYFPTLSRTVLKKITQKLVLKLKKNICITNIPRKVCKSGLTGLKGATHLGEHPLKKRVLTSRSGNPSTRHRTTAEERVYRPGYENGNDFKGKVR